MTNNALLLIKEHQMLPSGSLMTVAFSGGADSVALLHLIHGLLDSYSVSLQAVHVNHMLRGLASDNDEAFCKNFCSKLNIPFFSEKIDINKVAAHRKLSVEEAARDIRYEVFAKYAGNGKIATAHTASDNVETIIFNFTRGSGIEGLCGIPAVRGNVVRPLLTSSRSDVENYCREHNLNYCTDHTNFENDYNRNKIRNLIVPILKEINPSIEGTVSRNTRILKSDSDYLSKKAKDFIKNIKTKSGYQKKEVIMAPYPLASRIIKYILRDSSAHVSNHRISLLLDALPQDKAKIQLNSNCFFVVDHDFFHIENCVDVEQENIVPQIISLSEIDSSDTLLPLSSSKKVRLQIIDCKEIENIENKHPQDLKNLVDYDKIDTPLSFRARQLSDNITLYQRGVTKSLKKLFNEDAIAKNIRDQLVVVHDGNHVVWVENYGVNKAYMVSPATVRAIKISTKIIKN